MTALTLTPRTDAAMQSRFLKALRRQAPMYVRESARHPFSDHVPPILSRVGGTVRLAFQYGASLDDVAAACGLVDPPAVMGLDDMQVAS